mmetsp:Transcript_19448/g.28231  ORF Transcript_19448/g.28231 Transcript_19448/m.28231 type:complete len:149 (-) Transcript_19448:1133-1579(-)
MPFGLTNAPAVFTRLLNHIFFEELGVHVIIFYDDIIVSPPTLEAHRKHLDTVFTKLQSHKLYFKQSKCAFGVETRYLGHLVGSGKRKPDPDRITALITWRTPENIHEVGSFLDFTGYLRSYVPDFSLIAAPLTQLTKKDVPFRGTSSF